jgi:outer membrane protein TolC
MRWLPLTVLIAVATATGVNAQELTIEDAVRTALADNPEVHAAGARAAAAAARTDQAGGFRLPEIDLTQVYNYTDVPAEVFALTLNQERFDFGDFGAADPNNPDALDNWSTMVVLKQPIYTGGKIGARVDQARMMSSVEEGALAHTRERVAFDSSTAFINLAKAREHLELIAEARATTAEHLALAEAYASQGLILDAEVLKARVFLAEMDELLEQTRNQARLAEAALNFQLGADQGVPRTLAPLPPPDPVSGELEEWIDAALDRRHDLGAARLGLEVGRLEERVARSGYLPEIAVVGQYGIHDDTLFGTNGSSGSIMAFAKINLYRGGRDSAARASARHDAASIAADVRRFEEGIKLEVQQAWHDLESAHTRLATAANVLESAREALRVREHRFKQGLDRMIDLLDAETELREAQTRELVARYDVTLTTYRLSFVSGRSLIEEES